MNIEKLKDRISRSPFTRDEIAKSLGIDESTYYRKINAQGETFTVAQVKKLASILGLSAGEASEIFLE